MNFISEEELVLQCFSGLVVSKTFEEDEVVISDGDRGKVLRDGVSDCAGFYFCYAS